MTEEVKKDVKAVVSMFLLVGSLIIVFFVFVGMVSSLKNNRPARHEFRELVKSRLKDPDSARFSNDEVYEWKAGTYALCGYVNARNSFGGYIGDTRFVAGGQIVLLENEEGAGGGIFQALWDKTCHDA